MLQPAQLVLIIVIFLLSIVLSLCGVQVFFILKELRESIKKLNKILEDAGIISSSFAKPIASVSGFIMGLKSGTEIIKIFKGKKEA